MGTRWRNVGLVICWIKAGISKREIAGRTGLSVNQVHYYWRRHLKQSGELKAQGGQEGRSAAGDSTRPGISMLVAAAKS